ncbi:hypothetical protein [Saccharopolyspora endophytica]|uniref:Uncharacterized protein n=1 Tax=Saccharopolyspora endophytica TaxID=543886 RepID=A0ABS5DMK0_9PSEU|nr:hypothetical protein [Saccharopolyspora endophytica]MBQ0927538.1 hypothetical protein [Saccharopolyspora endophytica]
MTTLDSPQHINLDDTTFCPPAASCEVCGARSFLTCVIVESPPGVLCVTECPQCRACHRMPAWSGPDCATRAGEHCAHLGITRSEMTLARAREGLTDRPFRLPA